MLAINDVSSPSNHHDVVLDLEVLHCQLEAGHGTETLLVKNKNKRINIEN